MKIRTVNQWKTLPPGAGWMFGLFSIWYCRYAGGGSSVGIALCNLGIEVWKAAHTPTIMNQQQASRTPLG